MKLKKIYKVLIVLAIIIIVFVLLGLGIKKILFSNDNSFDRKEGVTLVSNETLNNINNVLLDSKMVKNATSRVSEKSNTILVTVEVLKDTTDTEAKDLITKILEKLTDEEKKSYDINVSLTSEDNENKKFPTMGYKSKTGSKFSWANKNIGGNNEV